MKFYKQSPSLNSSKAVLVAVVLSLNGCQQYQGLETYPAPPFGSYLRDLLDQQAIRAEPTDFLLEESVWNANDAVLAPAAIRRLKCLAEEQRFSQHPVMVESSGDSRLDSDRREAIIGLLSSLGVQLNIDIQLIDVWPGSISGTRASQIANAIDTGHADPQQGGRLAPSANANRIGGN